MARGWHGEHKEANTLKGVRFTVRKARVDDKDAKSSMAKGSMSAIVEFRSLFGEEDIDDPVAFDKWLSDMDADAPGISAIGDLRREEGLYSPPTRLSSRAAWPSTRTKSRRGQKTRRLRSLH